MTPATLIGQLASPLRRYDQSPSSRWLVSQWVCTSFQNFAGTFRFPAEFMPAEVKVIFEADDEVVVQRTYSWPADGQRGDLG